MSLAAAMAMPAAAGASPTLNVRATFPPSATVGDTAAGSLLITNASTFEDPSFTLCHSGEAGPCAGSEGIVVVPSCGAVAGSGGSLTCASGGADPGVVRINQPATGGAGTICAGMSFLVTTIDAALGAVRIDPTGGQDVLLAIGEGCRIDFTFTVTRSPAIDGSAAPGIQTLPVATAGARTYFGRPVAGGGSTLLGVGSAPPPAPSVTGVAPNSAANDNQPEVSGSAAAGTVVAVYVGAGCGGAPVAQGPAATFAAPGLTATVADDSTTTFSAAVSDPATGLGSACAAGTRTYVEDSAPPETTIVRGPSGGTEIDGPVVAFSSGDAGATFACRVDAGAFAACASPLQLPILAEGDHAFEARATDAARNSDPTPARRAFSVGTTYGGSLTGCTLHGKPIAGTSDDDDLRGTAAGDIIVGLSSSDMLRGLGGRDCLYGQGGTDRLLGGAASDLLFGGPDNDALDGDAGADRLSGESGNDRLDGDAGDDGLFGGAGHDRLTDRHGRDVLSGGAGNDHIDARDVAPADRRTRDRIVCGAGRDRVLVDRRDSVAPDCETVIRHQL